MMMKTITPTFPTKSSINNAIRRLSESDKARYMQLLEEYNRETSKDGIRTPVNHEKVASLISEAQELLSEH